MGAYAARPAIAGRPLNFVYFGGGTPSFLSVRQLEGPRRAADRRHAVERRGGDHVRVRARHAHRRQARGHSGVRRHAPEPRRRELRRRGARAERPGASVARDFPRVRDRAIARLSADQHRSHRRHARRDRRRMARERTADARAGSGQRDHLPDGAAVQHDHLERHPEAHRPFLPDAGELVDEAPVGRRGVRIARARGIHDRQRVHRREGSRREPGSSTAIACGRAPTSWDWAWPRSAT